MVRQGQPPLGNRLLDQGVTVNPHPTCGDEYAIYAYGSYGPKPWYYWMVPQVAGE